MTIENIRHSLAHILAYAVQELYPKVKLGIGPVVENGFYYDFQFPSPISDDSLPKIEKMMRDLIAQKFNFSGKKVSRPEAERIFKEQPFKLDLIRELVKEKKELTFYRTGKFIDLCRGGHVKNTKEINPDAFKLTRLAGAYWRGSEKNPMLTRVYGVAFQTKKELEDHLSKTAAAEKRDHRDLGKKLDLFVFSDLVGKGLPLYTEKGSIVRRELEKFIVEEETKRGYKHVYTPELAKVELYKVSGHYPYYKNVMYPVMKIDEEELILRPMTCPHHYQLYLARPHSYKELPFRIAELAKQFRYEKSGELTGLIRTRLFCLADAHIICQKEKTVEEINNVLELIEYVALTLGFKKGVDFRYRLSLGERTNEEKYYKDDKAWDFAENVLRSVLKKRKSPFFEAKNEAAFYGPKIDIQMKNFTGKEDTAFTLQYDFVAPKRFDLIYVDKDGAKKEPVVIHRSSIGAIERIIAFLLEHYEGAFPFWLSPCQIWVIPIGASHKKYAKEIKKELSHFRVEVRDDNETVSKRIRDGEIQKIPYLIVVGDKEMKTKSVGVRQRGKGDIGMMKLSKFIEKVKAEMEQKK